MEWRERVVLVQDGFAPVQSWFRSLYFPGTCWRSLLCSISKLFGTKKKKNNAVVLISFSKNVSEVPSYHYGLLFWELHGIPLYGTAWSVRLNVLLYIYVASDSERIWWEDLGIQPMGPWRVPWWAFVSTAHCHFPGPPGCFVSRAQQSCLLDQRELVLDLLIG